MRRILSLVALVLCVCLVAGCGKSADTVSEPKPRPVLFKTELQFTDRDSVLLASAPSGAVLTLTNRLSGEVGAFYELICADELVKLDEPQNNGDQNDGITLSFNTSLQNGKCIEFCFLSDGTVKVTNENGKAELYKAKNGTYKAVSEKLSELITQKNAYYTISFGDGTYSYALLDRTGKAAKQRQNTTAPLIRLISEGVVAVTEKTQSDAYATYYYEREKGLVSKTVEGKTDYLDGLYCSSDREGVSLYSIYETAFSHTFKEFSAPLSDCDEPICSVSFADGALKVSYYSGEEKALTEQSFDANSAIEAYKKAVEEKKKQEQAQAEALKQQQQTPPTTPTPVPSDTESTIPALTAENMARLEALSNTRSGHGWLGSEARQAYFSQYNAYTVADQTQNKVYLTFDEGYEYNNNTNKILDILKQKNVKAVFFVTLSFAKQNPNIVARMISEGHTVGNHSAAHPSFPSLSVTEAYNDIKKLHDYILQNYNYNMSLFRFPSGEYSDRMLALVQMMGYKTLFWNFAHRDWETANQPDAATAKNAILKHTKNGTLYLLHSVSNTNVSILSETIDEIRAKGFAIELFK